MMAAEKKEVNSKRIAEMGTDQNYGIEKYNAAVIATNLQNQKSMPLTYRAKRKNYKKLAIYPETKSAVRLDVRVIAEPAFPYNRDQLNHSGKIFAFVYDELRDRDREQFIILHLNSQLILNCVQIFPGTIDAANPYIREIIKTSLLSASNNIVLVHNHPSGDPEFSNKDNNFTREIKWAAGTMDIKLVDHIVIAGPYYKSYMEDEERKNRRE